MGEVVRHEHVTPIPDTLTSSMVSMRNSIDRDVIHIGESQSLLLQQMPDGLTTHDIIEGQRRVITQVGSRPTGWRPTVVLLSIEALFLDGRDDLPVDHERGPVMFTGRNCET